ncbi:MAG: winged helix-turn-helix transcriptional regulator [Archaeoglobaceae archaeon]|nr:winged helix-turn-helix transcriptional regulator [Archaeoglobaceae archaeon]MCX8152062.1 winged helix-turn-helix transcriptional regulator [Archaeoglobaceae archaeon]MDW8013827.1 winged helix-turn-helix transcriptional regulator [Archaeoglobaceae archaeon]
MILLNRKDTIKFLILTELIKNPECNQRDIAKKLELTPQAISEYFKELVSEELVKIVHKGYYEVTKKGEEWVGKALFDIHVFTEELLKKIYSKTIVAIAKGEIKNGDEVRYWVEDGFIFASKEKGNGIALTSAKDGEDVLIKPIEIFIPPEKGEIIIVKVPNVAEGGSRRVDLSKLSELVKSKSRSIVVAIGVEALITCRKIRVEPIFFGSKLVTVEAAHHGSGVIVVCTDKLVEDLVRTLIDEGLKFEVVEFNL